MVLSDIKTHLSRCQGLVAEVERRTEALEALCRAWRARVGAPLVTHGRPVGFDGRVAVIEFDASVWLSEWRHRAPSLTEALRGAPGVQGLASVKARLRSPSMLGPSVSERVSDPLSAAQHEWLTAFRRAAQPSRGAGQRDKLPGS